MKLATQLIKEVFKSPYKIYHNTFSDSMREMEKYAKKQGFEIDPEDYHFKVASGPRKPSEGKTNSYDIDIIGKNGKINKKRMHVQVYGRRNNYELNMYIA